MSLTSPVFLLIFVPVFLAGYYLTPGRFRFIAVLVMGLSFLYLVSPFMLILFLLSAAADRVLAHYMNKNLEKSVFMWIGLTKALLVLAAGRLIAGFVPHVFFGVFVPAGTLVFSLKGLLYLTEIKKRRQPLGTVLLISYLCDPRQLHIGPITGTTRWYRSLTGSITLSNLYDGSGLLLWGLFKASFVAYELYLVGTSPFGAMSPLNAAVALICAVTGLFLSISAYTDIAAGLNTVTGLLIQKGLPMRPEGMLPGVHAALKLVYEGLGTKWVKYLPLPIFVGICAFDLNSAALYTAAGVLFLLFRRLSPLKRIIRSPIRAILLLIMAALIVTAQKGGIRLSLDMPVDVLALREAVPLLIIAWCSLTGFARAVSVRLYVRFRNATILFASLIRLCILTAGILFIFSV